MTFIISVGGSLIVTKEGIDIDFLKSFRRFVLERCKKGDRLIIVTGGGSIARQYVAAAKAIEKIPIDDQDWLGIHATRLNAHLMRTLLRDVAHPEIITNPSKLLKIKSSIIIAGGYRPGWSTDYVAVLLAKKYKAKVVINLSNIDYVYDKDPKLFKNAKIVKNISWSDFRKIVGDKWQPGMNAPFDPVAASLAEQLKLKVVILHGGKIDNVRKFMNQKAFLGTVIAN